MLERSRKQPKRPVEAPYVPHDPRKRLGEHGIQLLLDVYRSGVPSSELPVQFGISKRAVLSILHEHGLAVRQGHLSQKQIDEARVLRTQGWTYDALGNHLGVYGSTVWRALQ